MEGFVIQLESDDENSTQVYWTESETALEDLNQANLYLTINEARLAAGKIQSSYTDHTVKIVPASKGITLKSNVAASFTTTTNNTI